jgi:hypothetical protein
MTNLPSSNLSSIYSLLTSFAKLDNFWELFDRTYRTQYDPIAAQTLHFEWQAGNFQKFPSIAITSQQALGNAIAAYDKNTSTIFISVGNLLGS